MNAAARALTQGVILTPNSVSAMWQYIRLSPLLCSALLLMICIVGSALSVITLTDKNRIAMGNYADNIQTRVHLETQYGQLLLEENTWAAPARINAIAQQQLHLIQPTPQQILIIRT